MVLIGDLIQMKMVAVATSWGRIHKLRGEKKMMVLVCRG